MGKVDWPTKTRMRGWDGCFFFPDFSRFQQENKGGITLQREVVFVFRRSDRKLIRFMVSTECIDEGNAKRLAGEMSQQWYELSREYVSREYDIVVTRASDIGEIQRAFPWLKGWEEVEVEGF